MTIYLPTTAIRYLAIAALGILATFGAIQLLEGLCNYASKEYQTFYEAKSRTELDWLGGDVSRILGMPRHLSPRIENVSGEIVLPRLEERLRLDRQELGAQLSRSEFLSGAEGAQGLQGTISDQTSWVKRTRRQY